MADAPPRLAVTGRQIAIRSPITRAISIVPTTVHYAASAGFDGTRSLVRNPSASTPLTAASMASAAAGCPSDQRSIIAADRTVPSGLAMSWPAISGAEPLIGSYSPKRPCLVVRFPS